MPVSTWRAGSGLLRVRGRVRVRVRVRVSE